MSQSILESKTKLQEAAKNIFAGLALPTLKNENFKYTSLRDFSSQQEPIEVLNPAQIDPTIWLEQCDGKMIRSARALEAWGKSQSESYLFTDILSGLRAENPVLKKVLEVKDLDSNTDYFKLMNLSNWQNGFFIHVPKNKKVELPLHALHYFDLESKAFYSRSIVVVDEGAELTFTDEWMSGALKDASGSCFYSGLVEVYLKRGARVRYSHVQNFAQAVQYFVRSRFVLDKDAQLEISQVNLGGKKGQVRLDIDVAGENASVKVLGATRGQNDQHFDFWVNSNHTVPHTQSDLVYYTVMAEQSRSVFNGKITITEKAVHTDASQRNRNLLLSNEAVIDTIPKLEISTDDVKCAHGATVSSVSEEALYYLMSRGISRNEATQIIVDGFTEPVIETLSTEFMRTRIRKAIQEKHL